MKERPILFSGPMVHALLDCTKTQTRRVVKHIPMLGEPISWCSAARAENPGWVHIVGDYRKFCPYGTPGDRLWVKETFSANGAFGDNGRVSYRADIADGKEPHGLHWKPSIFCTRKASRITLDVTAVRVERLNDISEADAKALKRILTGLSGGTTVSKPGTRAKARSSPPRNTESKRLPILSHPTERSGSRSTAPARGRLIRGSG